MKGKTTLEKVIEKVHEASINHYDEVVDVKELAFSGLNKIWVAGAPFEVLPTAQRLIANRLRVPWSYLIRCPADLQADNLNYWIEKEARQRDNLFCRFDGNKLRAVFTQRYTAIDHMEILSRIPSVLWLRMITILMALWRRSQSPNSLAQFRLK